MPVVVGADRFKTGIFQPALPDTHTLALYNMRGEGWSTLDATDTTVDCVSGRVGLLYVRPAESAAPTPVTAQTMSNVTFAIVVDGEEMWRSEPWQACETPTPEMLQRSADSFRLNVKVRAVAMQQIYCIDGCRCGGLSSAWPVSHAEAYVLCCAALPG